MFLTNRAIGQSEITSNYIRSLKEGSYKMPHGPVLLQFESVLGALETELLNGQPEVNRIAALSRVRGLFPGREPFWLAMAIRPGIYWLTRQSGLTLTGSLMCCL